MREVRLIISVAFLALSGWENAIAGALDAWSGLVAETSVAILEDRVETAVFASTFAAGIIADAQTYSDFGESAGHDFPVTAEIDWQSDLVVYVILEENTNWLTLDSWRPPVDGVASLVR